MAMSLSQRHAKLAKTRIPKVFEPPDPFEFIALSLVAFHLGKWRPDGRKSVFEAYSVGAGWDSPQQMDAAMRTDLDAWNDRHMAALAKMFGARGVDLDGGDVDRLDLVMLELVAEAENYRCIAVVYGVRKIPGNHQGTTGRILRRKIGTIS